MNTYVIKRLPEGVDLPDFKGELDRAWAECPSGTKTDISRTPKRA